MRALSQRPTEHDTAASENLSLLIGLEPEDLPHRPRRCPNTALAALPYILLHAALARAPLATEVISPLMSEHFDAMDLAVELNSAGFTGTYTVVVPPLPRPDIILQELAQIAPNMHINILTRAVC